MDTRSSGPDCASRWKASDQAMSRLRSAGPATRACPGGRGSGQRSSPSRNSRFRMCNSMASPVTSCQARANASAGPGSAFTPLTLRGAGRPAPGPAPRRPARARWSAPPGTAACAGTRALTWPSGSCHQPKRGAMAPKAAGPAARSVSMAPSRMVCSAGRSASRPRTVAAYSGRLSLRNQAIPHGDRPPPFPAAHFPPPPLARQTRRSQGCAARVCPIPRRSPSASHAAGRLQRRMRSTRRLAAAAGVAVGRSGIPAARVPGRRAGGPPGGRLGVSGSPPKPRADVR